MPREVAIQGVLLPVLLPIFFGCLLLMILVDLLIGRYGLYRHVWNPPLFRLAIFASLFGLAGILLLN